MCESVCTPAGVCICASLIGSFYCINVSNGSTLFNNVGSSFLCPSSPSHHVWSDSHMSHQTHHARSRVGHRDTRREENKGMEYDAERDAHKEERQLATCINFPILRGKGELAV